MRRTRISIALAATALLASACGSSSGGSTSAGGTGSSPAAASQNTSAAPSSASGTPTKDISGKLAWYSLTPPAASAKVVKAFTAKYPNVTVETTNFQGPDILDRVKAEASGGLNKFDVIDMAGRNPLRALAAGGLLADYQPSTLSTYPADKQKQIADSNAWVYGANAHGICYNAEAVKTPPTSYDDLLKPEYKGKIVYGAPIQTGFGQNFTVESKDAWGEAKWKDFWTRLGKQNVLVTDNPSTAMSQTVSGERPILMYCNLSALNGAVRKGAPIKWQTTEPNIANEVALAISAKAPNPEPARAFVDFMLSTEGQALVAPDFGLQPIMDGAPVPDAAKGLADVKLILSPSKFAVDELHGVKEFDKAAYSEYVAFMKQAFGK